MRDEFLEWMDSDTTKWDRGRHNVVSGIRWAKTRIPRIVVEMDAITCEMIWPQNAEQCNNYRPDDIDMLATAVNKIAEVQQMQERDGQAGVKEDFHHCLL